MQGRHKRVVNEGKQLPPPALDPESRENQVIAMAYDLAAQQIFDGTASSQVITHFLRLGCTKERLEKEKLERENELLKAKTEALKSAKRVEELYAEAINAMRRYSGASTEAEEDEDENILRSDSDSDF